MLRAMGAISHRAMKVLSVPELITAEEDRVPVPAPSAPPKSDLKPTHRFFNKRGLLKLGLFLFVIVGLILRYEYHYSQYQYSWVNDIGTHEIYIKYVMAHDGALPDVTNNGVQGGFEFPQMPLYYVIAAGLGSTEAWSWFGTLCSMASLIIVYRASFFVSSWLVRYGMTIFWAIDPFFVVHSTTVGNDCINCLCGAAFFYCLLAINRSPNRLNYWRAVWVLMVGLFTKLNTIGLLVAFPWIFIRTYRTNRLLLWRVSTLMAMGVIWFAFIEQRSWTGDRHRFMFDFDCPPQDIRVDYGTYFSTFELSKLMAEGQASLLQGETSDSVRFSFHTFLYANFLVGTWNYKTCPEILMANRFLFLVGLMIPLGLMLFLAISLLGYPFAIDTRFSFFNKVVCALFLAMYAMNVCLVIECPHTCHADPRLQFPTLPWVVYAFCRGWTVFGRSDLLKTLMWVNLVAFCGGCCFYYSILFSTNQLPYKLY